MRLSSIDLCLCVVQSLFNSSKIHFEEALRNFEEAKDVVNVALVSCNFAKLMRVGYAGVLALGRDTKGASDQVNLKSSSNF